MYACWIVFTRAIMHEYDVGVRGLLCLFLGVNGYIC